jgi:hypothetical protein
VAGTYPVSAAILSAKDAARARVVLEITGSPKLSPSSIRRSEPEQSTHEPEPGRPASACHSFVVGSREAAGRRLPVFFFKNTKTARRGEPFKTIGVRERV